MGYVILIIVGLLLGSIHRYDVFGMAVGAVCGFLLAGGLRMRKRLNELEAALKNLQEKGRANAKPISIAEVNYETAKPQSSSSVNQTFEPTETPFNAQHPAPDQTPSPPQQDSAAKTMWNENKKSELLGGPYATSNNPVFIALKEFFTGGNTVVRVGIIVLFFGVAFLLKYAADQNKLPLEARLIGVALGGVALLVIGWRLRIKKAQYALILQGGGIAILYLTVFASLRLYQMVPPGLALVILIALSVFSSLLAVYQNSQALAAFSVSGGFLAPVLVSTGSGQHVMLFGYYALLNVGILGIAWVKSWRILNLSGFLFTFAIGSLWGFRDYHSDLFYSVEPFLILFFLMYVSISVLFAVRQPPKLKGYVDGTLVFGTPIIAFSLQVGIVEQFQTGLAWSALGLGLFYVGLASLLWRKHEAGVKLLIEAFLALGIVFASLAIPLALDGRWTAAAWAMEGAALVWIGVRQERILPRLFGILLQIGAAVGFASELVLPSSQIPIFNGIYLGCFIISLAALFISYYLQKHKDELSKWEISFPWVAFIWGMLWWYVGGIAEIVDKTVQVDRNNAILLFFTFSSSIAAFLYTKLSWKNLIFPSLGLIPVLIGLSGFFYIFASVWYGTLFIPQYHPFENLAFIGWTIALIAMYFILKQCESGLELNGKRFFHSVALWLVMFIVTWEIAWQVDTLVKGAGTWPIIFWGIIPCLLILGIVRFGKNSGWPFAHYYEDYLSYSLAPIVGLLILWTMIANVISNGDPWPIDYLPLVNPLDLAQLFTFFVIFAWWWKAKENPVVSKWTRDFLAYFYFSGVFIWYTAVFSRTVHHWGDVPYTLYILMDSLVFHAAISIAWTLLAMVVMIVASKKQIRYVWFVGAGLMAIVVIKLFLVELSNSGTIARIVSFVVVGILLLIVGYLTPLPPKLEEESTA